MKTSFIRAVCLNTLLVLISSTHDQETPMEVDAQPGQGECSILTSDEDRNNKLHVLYSKIRTNINNAIKNNPLPNEVNIGVVESFFDLYLDTIYENVDVDSSFKEDENVKRQIAIIIITNQAKLYDQFFGQLNDFLVETFANTNGPDAQQFYGQVIDEVNGKRLRKENMDKALSLTELLVRYVFVQELASIINLCRNDYKLLDLFVQNSDVLKWNIRRQITSESEYNQFVFYELIHNYVNQDVTSGANPEIPEIDKFIESMKDIFVKSKLLCSMTEKSELTHEQKDEMGHLFDAFYTENKDNWPNINEALVQIANVDNPVPSITVKYDGTEVLLVKSFMDKNDKYAKHIKKVYVLDRQENFMIDVYKYIGCKYDETRYVKCPISKLMVVNAVGYEGECPYYDHTSVISYWLNTKLHNPTHGSWHEFYFPYLGKMCDVRKFLPTHTPRIISQSFLARSKKYEHCYDTHQSLSSLNSFETKFEQFVERIIEKCFTGNDAVFLLSKCLEMFSCDKEIQKIADNVHKYDIKERKKAELDAYVRNLQEDIKKNGGLARMVQESFFSAGTPVVGNDGGDNTAQMDDSGSVYEDI